MARQADAFDFSPGLLRIQDQPSSPLPRRVLYCVLGLFLSLLIWAFFGRLDVVAVAEGKLVPKSYMKIVQPADAGIILEILVHEGSVVRTGQVLMRMDPRLSDADSKSLQAQLELSSLQLRRIDAELNGRVFDKLPNDTESRHRQVAAQYEANLRAYHDAIKQEQSAREKNREDLASAREILTKFNDTLPVYKAQEQAFDRLARKGYVGKLDLLDRQRARIENQQDLRAQKYTTASLQASIAQSDKRIEQITSNYKQQLQSERATATEERVKLDQEWAKQQHRNTLLELKSPQDSIVKDISTHTVGTVVAPGTVLLTLVPRNETLVAEVWVKNEDAGFVHQNQLARIKVKTYPFQKYGMLDGIVEQIGADSSESPRSESGTDTGAEKSVVPLAYRAKVTLRSKFIEIDGRRHDLSPGMQVVTEISLGKRSVIDYLLSPVQRAFQEAGSER